VLSEAEEKKDTYNRRNLNDLRQKIEELETLLEIVD